MWDGYAYWPLRKDFLEPYYEGPTKVFDSRVEDGHHFRAEEFNPYGSNTKIPKGWNGWNELDPGDDTKEDAASLGRRDQSSWAPTSSW